MSSATLKKFIALVTFERNGDILKILPVDCHGASSWMAVKAYDVNLVTESIERELADIGLRLLEIDEVKHVLSTDEAAKFDPNLAENIKQWEPGKLTVWGTLHTYIGDGED